MIVLVTGGRNYGDQSKVFSTLDAIDRETKITFVIQGGATGADKHARLWAAARGRASATFHAHFVPMGSKAGPLRNGWMILYGQPELVVAFPGGKGTADMTEQANHNSIPVRTIT